LEQDILQAIALSPEHISCYSLTIEEKTTFGKWAAAGKLKPEPDEVSALHLETLMQELSKAGYEHYEISNFAKPGFSIPNTTVVTGKGVRIWVLAPAPILSMVRAGSTLFQITTLM
jgi:coproporphyrinogen III oxidase-like Fe-S oxidoreductase